MAGTRKAKEVTQRTERKPAKAAATPEKAGRERRVHPRILVDLEVDYRSEETFLFAYITDISAMGIFIRTNSPEPSGTRLNLRFRPTGGPSIEVEGRVKWVNDFRPGDYDNLNPGMGVEFEDISPAQREQIVNLVRTFAYLADEREDKRRRTKAKPNTAGRGS